MWYIKVRGMGKLIFADTYETYGTDTQIKHIEGFIIDQRSGIAGNFGVSDVKEVTFTVSADATTAEITITQADYTEVPEAGDYIWVRLKDDDKTVIRLEVLTVTNDEFVYTNDDAGSTIAPKHNTLFIDTQDWDTDDLVNAGDIVTLAGLTETADNTDWEVRAISLGAGDTTITLENVLDEDTQLTAQSPLAAAFNLTVDVDVDTEAVVAGSSIHAKENLITLLGDTRYGDDGLIEAGDSITLSGAGTSNDVTGDSSDGVHIVESISDDGTDTEIRIHNTTIAGDMVTDTLPDDGTVTITTEAKDITYNATGVTIFADRNDIEINYTGAVPEILSYLVVGDDITLTADGAGDATNDGTYEISEIDTTSMANTIIITTVEAIPSNGITNNTAGDKIETTDDVVFTNTSSSSNISEKISTLTWNGADLTDILDVGATFTLANTTESDGSYIVRTIDYNTTTALATTITVDNSNQCDYGTLGTTNGDTFSGTDEVIGSTYKNYSFTNLDTIVRAKSTLTVNTNALTVAHAVTGELYANTTTMNDLIIRRDEVADVNVTVEAISDDGTDTTILIEEHEATIADLASATLIAPDRTITYTNSDATSEIVASTNAIIIQCTSDAELDVLATYFDYPDELVVEIAGCSADLGGSTTNNGRHTVENIDINIPDKKFTMYISDATVLYDETLADTSETFAVTNDYIWDMGVASNITEVNAYLEITGATPDSDGYILAGDTISITDTDGNINDGDFEVAVISEAGGTTTISLVEAVKGLVSETLSGDEYISINDTVTVTNASATSEFFITRYAIIEWYGEDMTTYLAQNEVITLANTSHGTNDGAINIVDSASAVQWLGGVATSIWIDENLTEEASLPDGDPDTAVTITNTGNTITCTVGSDDVTSYVSYKTTESIVWTDDDLTIALPYFEAGDTIDIYDSTATVGVDTPLLADQVLTSAAEAGGDMTLIITGTDITDTYPLGMSDDSIFVNKSKTVDYIVGAGAATTGSVAVDVDRIVINGYWVGSGIGAFTTDGFITIDNGDDAGTYTIGSWNYDTDVAGDSVIILDASVHAWDLTEDTDPNGTGMTLSYEGTYKYTEDETGTSTATSGLPTITLLNQPYATAILEEFLEGDTFYMTNLSENTLIDDQEFTIASISGAVSTVIVVEESWQFVAETLDSTTEEFHTADELDVDITVSNAGEEFGVGDATQASFILTMDNDVVEPTTVKITNVDFNTPVYNIDTIWDDEP